MILETSRLVRFKMGIGGWSWALAMDCENRRFGAFSSSVPCSHKAAVWNSLAAGAGVEADVGL